MKDSRLSVEIHCDSRQLDVALMKMDQLIQKVTHAQTLGIPLDMVTATVGASAVLASPRRFSRRSLLGFWRG